MEKEQVAKNNRYFWLYYEKTKEYNVGYFDYYNYSYCGWMLLI